MDGLNESLPVKSVSIENMLRQRDAVMERIKAAVELLGEARDIAASAHVGFPRFKFEDTRYGDSIIDPARIGDMLARTRLEVDMGAWQYLMNESGLRTFMDSKAREEWQKAMSRRYSGGSDDIPEFNIGNVEATFTRLYAERGMMFERGVVEVFRGLAWCYKTNLPQKFGKRVVINYVRGSVTGKGTSLGYVNGNGKCSQLDDMVRVMSVLDGKPEPDHRHGWWGRLDRVRTTSDPDAEDDYLSARCFRNGNVHVTFKRPDLVAAMNRIIAKHYPNALPEPK